MLEALAATAFVAIALMGFAANTISLTRNEKTADSTSAAHALAQQKLEQLRSTPLGAPEVNPGNYIDAGNPMKADGTAGGTFRRVWTVSVNDVPSWGLRSVTVTVSWTDSQPHSTTLAAYVRCSKIPC
jgi:Tfp pilus assembly protein PilV